MRPRILFAALLWLQGLLAEVRWAWGRVGMGWGGVGGPVLWGTSRLPTSLWGSTAGLHYGRRKLLPSHPGQHRLLPPSRLLATACLPHSGVLSGNVSSVMCGRGGWGRVGVRHTGNPLSGLDPHSMGFPRGLGSRGLSTSASPTWSLCTSASLLLSFLQEDACPSLEGSPDREGGGRYL